MSRNKKTLLTLAFVVAIGFSFLLFFGTGNTEKTSIQIGGFVFIIISELIVYGSILGVTSKNSNTFSKAGILSATSIYLIISLIINILLKASFTTLKSILVCNFSILLGYAFVAIIITFFKKEK